MTSHVKNLSGKRFGKLLVINFVGVAKRHFSVWRCRCDCGNEKNIKAKHLVGGNTISCGCYQKNNLRRIKAITTHGKSYTPEYKLWRGIQIRCRPKDKAHKNYFDRGIMVSEEWLGSNGFLKCLSYIGKKPGKEYSLDRINNDRGYEPGNVRWATHKEQSENRRKVSVITGFSNLELMEELGRRGFDIVWPSKTKGAA